MLQNISARQSHSLKHARAQGMEEVGGHGEAEVGNTV